ncbi:MAG: cytidyltransferase-related domain protein [Oscillospiraceae bacterium]|jgi:nicotinic acid mononucleotide adenylyltransferase|nr:cytidyltransferase-related domain protein [Oscillospiraceae bacterium]
MNKKRIRQMTASLLRRLTTQPNLRYLAPHREMVTELLEGQNYLQRFVPLYDGSRIRCGDVLALCREELCRLSPEPEEGWIAFTYDFARTAMFPEPAFEQRQEEHGAGAVFFLSLLQVLFDAERAKLPADPMWQLELLEEEELADSAHRDSYRLFLRSYRREYVYEMMRLGLEATPWRTLEHIAGVHHVALSAARDLKRAGAAIDLGLVSGSAAGHDIGKFGCRPGERVPYLHYYYTDLWFRRRHMSDIGYVAANHSVWDLELDYLSIESLVLIYADFRVKQERGPDGREITKISTLKDAFDVILSKLDNVTEEKRTRYTFVYAKLRDFERYMVSLGVDTTLSGASAGPAPKKDVALMEQSEAVEALRLLGVEHNVALMSRLTGQRSFASLLELARGETDWRKLRAYLGVFESYSVYLSLPQKVQTLAFLYELLMHREGDIRRQAAALMGEIIARFHAGYVKEKPAGWTPDSRAVTDIDQWKLYLEKIIHPDHKLMPQHRRWVNFTLKMVVNSLLEKCEPDRRGEFLKAFLRYYRRPERLEDETAFQLLETATALPLEVLADRQRYELLGVAQTLAEREDAAVRAAAVLLLDYLRPAIATQDIILHALRDVDCSGCRSLELLRDTTAAEMAGPGSGPDLDEETVSEIFLDNLKTATPWIIKEVNIRLLTRFAQSGGGHLLHIATHLTNLVKVSDRVTVRHAAGNALLAAAPLLTPEERNEVAVELGRGLEIGQQEFSKYIPGYLGRFCLWLPPQQLEELLGELIEDYLCSSNGRVVSAALDTVGVIYEEYDTYRVRFPEEDAVYRRRRERLLGMLLKGLAGFRAEVRQEALFVLGRHVFGSENLGLHEKRRAFLLTLKKILALIGEDQGGELTFYYRAAMLGRIYRFLTEQEILHGGFTFEEPRPVAFFPGTFDPFTLSHKGIVRAIRDLGYEVLLAVDEFSWSKKTQPHRIRRRIAAISTADEFHVHSFPEDFPVNIANPANLAALRAAFPGREVAVVVGSDVVANASSYRKAPEEHSIHTFDHIIFRRSDGDGEIRPDYGAITGRVTELTLPPHLEEISSTRIREAIDQGRDISNLIDPVAQELIYRLGLYLREPLDKPLLRVEELSFQHCLDLTEEVGTLLGRAVLAGHPDPGGLLDRLRGLGDHLYILRQGEGGAALGFASFRCLDSHQLFSRLGSADLSAYVRAQTGGRALVISGIYVPRGAGQLELCQLLLTEVLTLALRQEYTYALFCPAEAAAASVREVLTLQGFVPAPVGGGDQELLCVDMRRPVVLTRNVNTAIKAPFASNPRVLAAMAAAHRRLQKALTEMYPGCLVLSMSAGVTYQRLLRRIAACNGVPPEPAVPRSLGECICVPFGKILRGVAVPNTVTKTLHTDKVYEPDLSRSSIESYPFYASLPDQVRTIRAFDRPVILVDDMLHDGKRIRRIAPLLRENGAQVRQVLVGYLTGVGRDTMEQLGLPVDSVYYLPNLRMRFVESTLYPFIGGDTVRREEPMAGGLQPAVNRIFPYAAPDFSEDCADGSTYRLSLVCLENARDILLTLETEYRALYARNLTLSRLGEAVILPLCPDKGSCMSYDLSRAASTYLDNDIEMLKRLKASVKIVIGG